MVQIQRPGDLAAVRLLDVAGFGAAAIEQDLAAALAENRPGRDLGFLKLCLEHRYGTGHLRRSKRNGDLSAFAGFIGLRAFDQDRHAFTRPADVLHIQAHKLRPAESSGPRLPNTALR